MNTINPERVNNIKKSLVFLYISLLLSATTVTVAGSETVDLIINNLINGFSILALMKSVFLIVRD